jgi:hypothetical protein
VLEKESAARAALAEFVADVGADPDQAIYASGSYRETKRYLAEYDVIAGARRPVQREPDHSYSKSEFFRRELPPDAVDELLAYFAQGRHARVLDFTPWAGAYNRVPTDATAFAHRAERFLLKQEVVVDPGASEAERQAARGWLSSSWGSCTHGARTARTPTSPTPSSTTGAAPTTARTWTGSGG